MQVKKLLTDDEGVSPVIGVILMVAITVILAAVIAAFVLGIGDTDDPAPSASLNYDFTNDTSASPSQVITIAHESGDSFAAGDVRVDLEGTDGGSTSFNDGTTLADATSLGPEDELGPGDEVEINSSSPPGLGTGNAIGTGTIELVWAPGGGDAQSIFSENEFRNVGFTVTN